MTDDGTASPASASLWEDFLDILYAPAQVFERRKNRSGWLILLLVTAALLLLFFAWQRALWPVMDLEMQRAVAQRAGEVEIGPEQMEAMRRNGRIFGPIMFAVAFPVGVILAAVVTWGLARGFGAAATFATALMVVAYAQIVRIVQFAVGLLQSQFLAVERMDSVHDISLSLARFLDQPETGAVALNLAARVDVFTVWATALIAIGLHTVTRLSRASAWAVALLVWLIAGIPQVMGGLAG